MNEKLKSQQRDNELERLRHELEMTVLNKESIQEAEQETPDNRCILFILFCPVSFKQTIIQMSSFYCAG